MLSYDLSELILDELKELDDKMNLIESGLINLSLSFKIFNEFRKRCLDNISIYIVYYEYVNVCKLYEWSETRFLKSFKTQKEFVNYFKSNLSDFLSLVATHEYIDYSGHLTIDSDLLTLIDQLDKTKYYNEIVDVLNNFVFCTVLGFTVVSGNDRHYMIDKFNFRFNELRNN